MAKSRGTGGPNQRVLNSEIHEQKQKGDREEDTNRGSG